MSKFFLVICFLSAFSLAKQEEDYSIIFGDDYEDAISMVNSRKWKTLHLYNQDTLAAAKAMAVIFPELIRYSMIRDFFETSMLEIFYVQNGKESADFSIGAFQMKPSFIEELEILSAKNHPTIYRQIVIEDSLTESEKRSIRLDRLKDETWQLRYLKAFIQLYSDKESLNKFSVEKQVVLLAHAFNHGIETTVQNLTLDALFAKTRYFPYGTKYPGKQYSYAAIASFFYKNYQF
jgi:hypothetical protein